MPSQDEELEGLTGRARYLTGPCFSVGTRSFKVLLLLFICWITIGAYFTYDAPGALEKDIKQHFQLNGFQFGLAYSMYTVPNIILPFFGGVFIARVGTRQGAASLFSLVFLGSLICCLAPHLRSYYTFLLGRFIFGLGSESLNVAQNNMCVEHFHGSSLATTMAMATSVSRLGTVLVFNVLPIVADNYGFTAAMWFAFLFVITSGMALCAYFVMDRRIDDDYPEAKVRAEEIFEMHEIATFNPSFWIICVVTSGFYSAIFPFSGIANQFFQDKYGYTSEQASRLTSVIILISMVCSTPLGFLTDRFIKHAPHLVTLGASALVPAFLLLGFTSTPPVIPVMLLGFSFSLVPSALWPSIAQVVYPHQVSTAYGLCISIQNIALTLAYVAAGVVQDRAQSFGLLCMYFATLSVFSILASLMWAIVDSRNPQYRLHKPPLPERDLYCPAPSFDYYDDIHGQGKSAFDGESDTVLLEQ